MYYKVVVTDNRMWSTFKNCVLSGDTGKFPLGTKFHADVVGETETGDTVVRLQATNAYTKRKYLDLIPDPIVTPPPEPPDLPPIQPPVPEPLPQGLWIVRGDEELAEYGYKSRTAGPNWGYLKTTPSVFRFDKFPVAQPTEYRVSIVPMDRALRRLNGYDADTNRIEYLYSSGTALFNRTGYPKLQYLTMSFNFLQGMEIRNGCLKFKTLIPTSDTAGMCNASHPWFVHKWDNVTMRTDPVSLRRTTVHVTTPHQDVFWYLTTAEGFGYIPLKWVRPYPMGEE